MTFPWVKRADLVAVPHDSGGWVVKDPLTLQYALLDDCEYSILNLLDGRQTFPQLLHRARQVAPALQLTAEDLAAFIQSLAGNQLVRQRSAGDSLRLNPESRHTLLSVVVGPLLSLLRIQVRLLNPTALIDRVMPLASVLFRRTTVWLFFLLAAVAVGIVAVDFAAISRELPTMQEFLGPRNILLMLVVFVLVKVLHEFGHAVTARWFGAECSECGFMLMVFTPVLYTNVSDTWLLTRRQRMLVTAAGILVELAIASVCTILWWNASPGLTRSILLNTMILCSVNTVLFNGNPLLRFDGYFLLADWLRLPNLAGRSSEVLRDAVVGLVTGHRSHEGRPNDRQRSTLLAYGICSAIYRVVLTLAILKLVDELSAHWHVRFLGGILFVTIAAAFIVMPAISLFAAVGQVHRKQPFSRRTWGRVSLFLAGVVLVAAVPLPRSLVAPAFVQPAMTAVYAPLAGHLQAGTAYGSPVVAGTPIVELSNSDLLQIRHRLQSELKSVQQELNVLLARPDTAGSDQIPSLKEAAAGAEIRLKEFDAEYQLLTVAAPQTGTFLSPPAAERQRRDDLPVTWYGRPAESFNRGAWIERGTLLGYVGTPQEVRLLIAVNEDDVEYVAPGQEITFAARGNAAVRCRGSIEAVALAETQDLPLQFSISGLVAGQVAESSLVPSQVTFLCTAKLDDAAAYRPALYSTGHVRIVVGSASLLDRVQRYLRQTF